MGLSEKKAPPTTAYGFYHEFPDCHFQTHPNAIFDTGA
jgi:hypothetical protein